MDKHQIIYFVKNVQWDYFGKNKNLEMKKLEGLTKVGFSSIFGVNLGIVI